MSASCKDECFMLGLSCTDGKTCQHLFLTRDPKRVKGLRDCCGASSFREVPRRPEGPGVHPGCRYNRNRALGSKRIERPQQRALTHRDSPSGSSSSSSPSTTSPPSEVFRLKRTGSSSGRWNEVLRLELRLPVELERCFAANEALRSSEPGTGGNSEVCASGDIVCCPSILLVLDAVSLKAGDDGVGGLEFRRSRLNFGISIGRNRRIRKRSTKR